MRILLTRPEAPALALKEKLEALGHQVALAPILSIQPVEFTLDIKGIGDIGDIGGIVMTSASAAPALTSAGFSSDIAVYAIGSTSARAARAEGFGNIISGDGDRRAFAQLILEHHDPSTGPLLHLAGSHRAGDIVAELQALGLKASGVRVYEAVAETRLAAHIPDLIRNGRIEVILFFSPRSAEIFLSLALSLANDNGLGDALSGISALCLSDAVARAAGEIEWKELKVAPALTEAAMIEALDNLIQ